MREEGIFLEYRDLVLSDAHQIWCGEQQIVWCIQQTDVGSIAAVSSCIWQKKDNGVCDFCHFTGVLSESVF